MKKATGTPSANGTSFHGQTIQARPQEIIDVARKYGYDYWDGNTGDDKTNFDFVFETEGGVIYTIYDWKQYRKLELFEKVTFHIGAKTKEEGFVGARDLINELLKLK